MLIKTLKVVKLKVDDVNGILASIKSQQNLTPVRAALIENKGDYVEAFTCQLNYEPMKKGIFRWLDATLEFL